MTPDEFQLQRAYCYWFNGVPYPKGHPRAGEWNVAPAGVPGVILWSTPNGGAREGHEAKRLKESGVLAGVYDLFHFFQGRLYGMEWKQPGGRLSPAQQRMHPLFIAQGIAGHVVVDNLPEAKAFAYKHGLAIRDH